MPNILWVTIKVLDKHTSAVCTNIVLERNTSVQITLPNARGRVRS